ncbi:hypothetical protein [Catelliglobosispora koreensis]|uniref:hypothetical protein n=1 Tax=Catelliglobosispora koreensis TaxID=129052 RepID=UPI0003786D4B|nr:hypothetical protein [Catelliglobosispora koreensis]
MNLTDELRLTMRDHAEAAPEGTSLMAAVRTRSQQQQRRRRTIGVSVALVAAVGVAIPVLLMRQSPAPTQSAGSNLVWVGEMTRPYPADLNLEGVEFDYYGVGGAGGYRLENGRAYNGTGEGEYVSIGTTEDAPATWQGVSSTADSVRGRPALAWSGTLNGKAHVRLTWQDEKGRWLAVSSAVYKADTPTFIKTVAETLKPGTWRIAIPYRFAKLPKNVYIVTASQQRVCFAVIGQQKEALCFQDGPPATDQTGKEVTVRGQTGRLAEQPDGSTTLALPLSDTRWMMASAAPGVLTSPADLAAIAEYATAEQHPGL